MRSTPSDSRASRWSRVKILTLVITGGIRWALGLVDADITPPPYLGKPYS
jgi:hypothetical protein